MNNAIFQRATTPKPPRSRFDLSHSVEGTYDMGLLYPVQCDLGIPGDLWNMSMALELRAMPMVAPILDNIRVFFHSWKIPIRLLDENFEDFVPGGERGDNAYSVPRWTPTLYDENSLWTHLGMCANVIPTGKLPIIYPLNAYNLVFNEHYRDENLIDPVALDQESLLRRAYQRDYFNAASPVQQKGTAPTFPLTGAGSALWPSDETNYDSVLANIAVNSSTEKFDYSYTGSDMDHFVDALNNNTIDLSSVSTFSLNDFRLVAAVQQHMELMQRTGARYPEYLEALFGVKPPDYRLQRPDYIGGTYFDVTVSEVLQTSETGSTPQGTLTGHGIIRSGGNIGTVKCEEWCIILTLMSIMPESVYNGQGINKQWLMETKEDWYNPLFANLAEQPIYRAELFASAVESENNTVFGYQGRDDHHRQKPNRVVGKLQSDFDEWTLARKFDPGSPPLLNESFIECNPENRFSVVPSEPAFLAKIYNIIPATRPLPALSSPGLRRI